MVYENDDCKVIYNLWGEGGTIAFSFFNKTDKNIYINLDECFFISNGVSYDYFKNRTFTNSSVIQTIKVIGKDGIPTGKKTKESSKTSTFTSGNSVSVKEKKVITIPAYTSKNISEYSIHTDLIRNCDLFRYPKKAQLNSIDYQNETSPIVFSNIISYSTDKTSQDITSIKNEFYVGQITNYMAKDIISKTKGEYCGEVKIGNPKSIFTNQKPNRFYIKYNKAKGDSFKH